MHLKVVRVMPRTLAYAQNIAAHTLLFEQESAHAGAHASTVQSLVVPLYQILGLRRSFIPPQRATGL
jgi:hypothetical protein